jgi:hypothetical protein
MAYHYSCFISYAHGQGALMKTFVEQLREGFESELAPYFPDEEVYVDFERLKPGFQYNAALARSICRSVAMVVVYTPTYERSEYCRREFTAMRQLQQVRLQALAGAGADADERGLVIPVMLRGRLENLPEAIREHTQVADFSRYTTADRRLIRNQRYVRRIGELAEYIHLLHQDLCAAGVEPRDCDTFTLPETGDAGGLGVGAPPSVPPLRS